MDLATVLVNGSAVALLGLIPWWFWFWGGTEATATHDSDVQMQTIVVRGGYAPDRITVQAGVPLKLTFDRQEDDSCSEIVMFPDFAIHQSLAAFASTTVTFTPTEPGEFPFMCEMNMLRGKLVVTLEHKE